MDKFLSCDWGTSAFRLRLISAENLSIIEETTSKQGIADTFMLWKQRPQKGLERLDFYIDIIANQIKTLEERTGYSLENLPLIISGMASSTIGMVDLPYKNLPFSTLGKDLEKLVIKDRKHPKLKILVISGVRTENDVIRGEETKLVGCAADIDNNQHVFIFPGTHPKHVFVKTKLVVDFKTYMTGEFFDLLSTKSILSVSVKKNENFEKEHYLQSFERGVNESLNSNLLHSCFLVRTNQLFLKYSEEENYFYLSGLLIGTELKSLSAVGQNITIVANEALGKQYNTALQMLNIPVKQGAVSIMNADEALIKGQWEIYKNC